MKWALLAAGTLSLAGVAVAAEGRGDPARRAELVKRFDANKDGQLDEAERQAAKQAFRELRQQQRQEKVARFDTNGDGKLDEAERQAAREERAVARFKALDKNGDNVLSVDEFKAGQAERGFHGRRGGGKRGGGMR